MQLLFANKKDKEIYLRADKDVPYGFVVSVYGPHQGGGDRKDQHSHKAPRREMNEASWYKWLVISTLLHFAALAAFSIPISKVTRKIDLSSAYSVSLVGDMGGGNKGVGIPKAAEAPVRETPKPAKVKKPEPVKDKTHQAQTRKN